jgi:glycosyltransferase involved in cell wall biosynthesis
MSSKALEIAGREGVALPLHRNGNKPRVIIVGPLPPPLGGVQLLIDMLMRSGFARDHDVRVVNTSKGVLRWAVEKATWRTIPYFFRDLWNLTRTLIRWRADVVVVHTAPNYAIVRDWVLMLLSRLFGKRVICYYHGTLHTVFPSAETRTGRITGRIIMAPAHRVIVVGPTYRERFADAWQRGGIVWAPNFTEVHAFEEAAMTPTYEGHPPWIAPGERAVLFMGRLSRLKGIWDLFDAIPAVIAAHPNTRFLLCGVAETLAHESVLREAVLRQNVADCVTFLGSREGRSKIDVWLSATVFVSPSLTEAFPLVIPEAMAAGVPMVVTNVGAIPDFVKNGEDGFLIHPNDPPALADRINRLLGDENLRGRIARHVRQRARHEFSVEVNANVVGQVIRDVLAK